MYTERYYVTCLILSTLDLCHIEINLDQKCVFFIVTFQKNLCENFSNTCGQMGMFLHELCVTDKINKN